MKQTIASIPHTVIFDRAGTLEDLKKLSPETKSRLLLARLARIGAMHRDALNKLNLMLQDDPYQLAYGYSAGEKDAVRQHLLGVPWTNLVNGGFLADYRGQGFFSVTDEGKEFLETEEGVAADSGIPSLARSTTGQQETTKRPWLPQGWKHERSLSEGGQGWTHLVKRAPAENSALFVLKRLKNRNRADRFIGKRSFLPR